MKKLLRNGLGLLLCMILLWAGGCALAANEGGLTIELASFEGVEFAIYQIGVRDTTSPSGWSASPDFKGLTFPMGNDPEKPSYWSAEQMDQIIQMAQSKIQMDSLMPTAQQAIGFDGTTTFNGLADGLYCGIMVKGPKDLVYPFLATIPAEGTDDPRHVTTVLSNKVNLPEPISVDVRKEWIDEADRDGIRPGAVRVYLVRNGVRVPDGTATHYGTAITNPVLLNQENYFYYKWDKLDPLDINGVDYVYTVEEEPVSGYMGEIVEKNPGSFVITNTHVPPKGSLMILKQMQLNGENTTESMLNGLEFTFMLTGPTRDEDFASLGIRKTEANYVENKEYMLAIYKGTASLTIHDLTPGHYIVNEIGLPEGITLVENLSNQGKEILVEADNIENIPVANFVNNLATGGLRIENNVTVNGEATDTTQVDGTYTFVISGPKQFTRTINLAVQNGKMATMTLRGLLPGTYTITEDTSNMPAGIRLASINGEPVTGNSATVEVEADGEMLTLVSFVNDLEAGCLSIMKSVTVNGSSSNNVGGTFSFTVAGPNGYKKTVEITITKGQSNIVTLTGLPLGKYTVTEDTVGLPFDMYTTGDNGVTKELKASHTDKSPLMFNIKNNQFIPTPPPSTPTPPPTPTPTPTPISIPNRVVTVHYSGATDFKKEYDGSAVIELDSSEFSLSNIARGDSVTVKQAEVLCDSAYVGTYDNAEIRLTLESNSSRYYYVALPIPAKVIIRQAVVRVIPLADQSKYFSDAEPELTFKVEPEGAEIYGELLREWGEQPGQYRYTLEQMEVDENHRLELADEFFTIFPLIDIAGLRAEYAERYIYTGDAITPAIRLYDGETPLYEGEDYTVTFADNIYPGTAMATVTGMGHYAGTLMLPYKITGNVGILGFRSLLLTEFSAASKPNDYVLKELLPTSAIATLDNGASRNVALEWDCPTYDQADTGIFRFTARLTDSLYTLAEGANMPSVTLNVQPLAEGEREVQFALWNKDALSKVYDGTSNSNLKVSDFIVSDNNVRISRISASYDSSSVGERKVIVSFNIEQRDDTYIYVMRNGGTMVFDGSITPRELVVTPAGGQSKVYGALEPSYLVGTVSGKVETEQVSVTGRLGREPGENVGDYQFTPGTLDAGPNYDIVIGGDAAFRIIPKDVSNPDVMISTIPNQKYTGSAIEPGVRLRYARQMLEKGIDYTLSFSNNVEAGQATVTITGLGNFTGTRTTYFRILKTANSGSSSHSSTTVTGTVINEDAFPDEALRDYVLDFLDTDQNGLLSDTELRAVTELDVSSCGIQSLKGIELFTTLSSLNCSYNQLTALDVTNNPRLSQLYCMNNQLTTLTVDSNALLSLINCKNNRLNGLDLSGCIRLQKLYCYSNSIISLDVSPCPTLVSTVEEGTTDLSGSFAAYAMDDNGYLACDKTTTLVTRIEPDGVLPEELKVVGEEAFLNCGFKVVVIPFGAMAIEARAFADCLELKHIYIPGTVTSIADDAFANVPRSLTIHGIPGTQAEIFASQHGYTFAEG